jgi:hypothetical protein
MLLLLLLLLLLLITVWSLKVAGGREPLNATFSTLRVLLSHFQDLTCGRGICGRDTEWDVRPGRGSGELLSLG